MEKMDADYFRKLNEKIIENNTELYQQQYNNLLKEIDNNVKTYNYPVYTHTFSKIFNTIIIDMFEKDGFTVSQNLDPDSLCTTIHWKLTKSSKIS
jgi:hypothetical protein